MKLLAITGLQLGTDAIPESFPARIAELCRDDVGCIALLDAFAPSTNPRALMRHNDYRTTLGSKDGVLAKLAMRFQLHWLLGLNDYFILDSEYDDTRERLERRGTVIYQNDCVWPPTASKMLVLTVGTGDLSFYRNPPGVRFPSLHRLWRRIDPRHRPRAKYGWQDTALARERIHATARRLHRKSDGKVQGIIHGASPEGYWGKFGGVWCGSPGPPPGILVVYPQDPSSGQIVR